MTIHGNGSSRRNFIYVDDVSSAIDIILEKGEINQIYNIGSENEYSVLDIAELLLNKIRPNNNLEDNIEHVTDRNFNDRRYAIDYTKLKLLGWHEKTNFIEGIQKTIDWIQNNKNYW